MAGREAVRSGGARTVSVRNAPPGQKGFGFFRSFRPWRRAALRSQRPSLFVRAGPGARLDTVPDFQVRTESSFARTGGTRCPALAAKPPATQGSASRLPPVGQRHVLSLGEINASQRVAWQKAIEVFDEQDGQTRQCALFPAARPPPATDTPAVQVQINQLQLSRPRAWGACWLGDQLWRDFHLDIFFAARLGLQPRRHGLGESPAPAHALPAAFPRQRMALAQALVCHHRRRRSARRGRTPRCWPG